MYFVFLISFLLFLLSATPFIYTLPYTTLFRSRLAFQRHRMDRFRHARFPLYFCFPLIIIGDFSKTSKVTKGQIVFNRDRKSTRLNSSHLGISYAVFCLKKKKNKKKTNKSKTKR